MIKLNFEKGDGLVPAIAQDWKSGEIFMMAYMNKESWDLTLKTGIVHYWSRSRSCLWKKGESSGNIQLVKEIRVDCNVSGSKPIEVQIDEMPESVEKMSIEAEQIGDKVVKVSFTEYVGRRKKITRIEVKQSELDQMIKEKENPVSVQLMMF